MAQSKVFYVLGEDAKKGDLLEANPLNGVLVVIKNRESLPNVILSTSTKEEPKCL